MPAIYRNKKRGGAWTFPLFRYMVSLFKQHQNVHFNGTQKDTDGHRFYFNVPMNNRAMC